MSKPKKKRRYVPINEVIPAISSMAPKLAIRVAFGKNLERALRVARMRQVDLHKATGLGEDLISGYIRGRSIPGEDALQKICKAVGVQPAELIPAYGEDTRAMAAMPALEIRQAEGGDMVYLRVNQTVTPEQAARIQEILLRK